MSTDLQFLMPDVGEGLTEAEITGWRVEVGDTVAINDVVAEIETAKAVVELPSPFAGVVVKIHHPAGAVVEVGQPIITIGSETDTISGSATPPVDAGKDAQTELQGPIDNASGVLEEPEERHSVLVGYGPARTSRARRPRKPEWLRGQQAHAPAGHLWAAPPVRKLAKDLGVDPRTVRPSGSLGQVTRQDILDAATGIRPSATAGEREVRHPIRGVRKAVADAMVASAFTAPHVTEWVTVDVTKSVKLVERMRSDPHFAGLRVSPLLLVLRAAVIAIRRNPQINGRWDAQAGEIVELADINLGVAAATPRGLIVPNIRRCQELTTRELADALTQLVDTARAGRTKPEDMRHGTFTVTNIGVFGVDGGTPILNPGEAAILCVGQIRELPWAHKGRVRLRKVATLALSFDHRLVDGELGSRVLADIARVLAEPDLALAW